MAIVGERVPLEDNVLAGLAALLSDLDRWQDERTRSALARVVRVEGSPPPRPGPALAVNERGESTGSISPGPVDDVVAAAARKALHTGRSRMIRVDYDDGRGSSAGLICGGTVHVLVELLDG